jgi:uroporphyrinogen decarboxylase
MTVLGSCRLSDPAGRGPITRRERVLAALSHQRGDGTPYSVSFTPPAWRRMADCYGDERFHEKIGEHLARVSVVGSGWGQRDAEGFFTDDFGTRWDRRIESSVGLPLPSLDRRSIDAYPWPDPAKSGRFDELARVRREQPDIFLLLCIECSLFERAWALVGFEQFLMDLAAEPRFAGDVLDRILDFNLGLVAAGLDACPDVDGVLFGDDFGAQNGLLVGPELWHKTIAPRLARQYAAVKERGKKLFVHSCGKIDALIDDFCRMGVDCLNPLQPEAMNVYDLKDRYGERLAFYGGIGTQQLLSRSSPAGVREELGRILERLGRDGGYIASPGLPITGDLPAENVHAMIEVFNAQIPTGSRMGDLPRGRTGVPPRANGRPGTDK